MFLKIIVALWTGLISYTAVAQSSMVVVDNDLQTVVVSHEMDSVRPIASITKLMTAMVALDYSQDLSEVLPLNTSVKPVLPRGQYRRGDLIHALLIRSDNAAAETLAANFPGGRSAFVERMNFKSKSLGLQLTAFSDPSGLSRDNVSTAVEVAKIVAHASNYQAIRDISTMTSARLTKISAHNAQVTVRNTNSAVLTNYSQVQLSKTGFTRPAGYCMSLLIHSRNRDYIVVVLGEKTKQARLREIHRIMHDHILG